MPSIWTYGLATEAHRGRDAAQTPGLLGQATSPTAHPFHGCFLAQSASDAAHKAWLPGHKSVPEDPAGHAGEDMLEQEEAQVESGQRMVPPGQERAGVADTPLGTQVIST